MFRKLLRAGYPENAIGFGVNTVTAVALKQIDRDRYRVSNAATAPLREGLLNASFEDPNISDTSELAATLENLVLEAGLGSKKKWSAALPSASARTAIITLEEVPGTSRELDDVIDWKAETVFGVKASELRISRIQISASADGRKRYFAAACRLDVLEDYEIVFNELGWQMGLIVPRLLGESNWFSFQAGDSLLISAQVDGFSAVLIRDREPVVVRSVRCDSSELDDEIYRLLVYYQDRFEKNGDNGLARLMVLGDQIDEDRISEITKEAMGKPLGIVRPRDLGFEIPTGNLRFCDLAAPAGLATLGCK